MRNNVSDYVKYNGYHVSCVIEGELVKDGMIVFEGDRMYIFQSVRAGAAPNNFRELNLIRGVNYLASWSAGIIGTTIDPDIRDLKVISKGFSKPTIKENEVYMTFDGEKFYVHKYFENSDIILFKNSQGKVCKMMEAYDLKYSLVPEKEYKPIAEKDKYNFYVEDIFSKMIYKPSMASRIDAFLSAVPRTFNGNLTLPDGRIYRFANGAIVEEINGRRTVEEEPTAGRFRIRDTRPTRAEVRPGITTTDPFVITGMEGDTIASTDPINPELAARLEAQRLEHRNRQLESERQWMNNFINSLTGTRSTR